MKKKILITGGAVHTHLDSVKIITNKFRGGRMAELATKLAEKGFLITYLTSKGNVIPDEELYPNINIIYHEGFEDYEKKVLELGVTHDGLILGAAVVNLLPYKRWENKFNSHDYEEGDIVPFAFKIAPRVINTVKPKMPRKMLIGFKLLKNVSKEELIEAAYTTLIESNANFVIANDASNLDKKLVVTKEKSVIPLEGEDLVNFIRDAIEDVYYSTVGDGFHLSNIGYDVSPEAWQRDYNKACETFDKILEKDRSESMLLTRGYDKKRDIYFGSVSVKISAGGFITSERGKKSLKDRCVVYGVDHEERRIYANYPHLSKPSLNTPLIDNIFTTNPNARAVVHFHCSNDLLHDPLEYCFPGTVRDSFRGVSESFNIKHHGAYILLDKNLEIIHE